MKRFALFGIVWIGSFLLINGISFFALSDGHGIRPGCDQILRVGWPSVIFEEGGFVNLRAFYFKGALVDLAFAGCFAAIVCILFAIRFFGDQRR